MNLLKIAVTGPESTGKSKLAGQLANHFKTSWVQEYARDYLTNLGRPYEFDDLAIMARKQLENEKAAARMANKLLFCDTDFVVYKIWSLYKYGKCDPWIRRMADKHRYDLYLLCNTDLPWEDDPLREHPDERDVLLELYMKEFKRMHASYILVSGTGKRRTENAIKAIQLAFTLNGK